jgi:hypothetical protein
VIAFQSHVLDALAGLAEPQSRAQPLWAPHNLGTLAHRTRM